MATPSNHQSQTDKAFRDFTQTPPWLFHAFDAEFHYDLDAAALDESALCERYYTPKIDGLAQDWSKELAFNGVPRVWINPPFSNILPWIEKAKEQRERGVLTTLLVPHENRAEWWPYDTASEIRDIVGYYVTRHYKSGKQKGEEYQKWVSGGISFIDAKTGQQMPHELNKPMCLIVFNPFHTGPTIYKPVRKDFLMRLGQQQLDTLHAA
ncbi:DNA N-6-adenine-methyltransferase [Salinivibrio socompensis]|uniref:DNA N-6-adenine-methyltransferase n=1 Tax=Salinivibrio socompensis TaxID=1510206 RepID=UPI00046F4159|nr:DNA N-6-adenine-methyltransferase [Salinivibrio socompensis]